MTSLPARKIRRLQVASQLNNYLLYNVTAYDWYPELGSSLSSFELPMLRSNRGEVNNVL